MPSKRANGTLRSIIVHERPATNPVYAGATSRIVKLLTVNDQHIGTVHEIVWADGTVAHSHPKDYTRRNCERIAEPLPIADDI
ncbi:MAG: hypothetical protein F4X80_00545 [Chloroflexi bacterium]|nr:hypothetical protein [Chloroflexota bacterium]MYE31166.1 hypothetical protein [Chloroflexota bacterium]